MNAVPPTGSLSLRERAALGILLALTVLFLCLLVYRIVQWLTTRTPFPLLAAIGGVGGFVATWR